MNNKAFFFRNVNNIFELITKTANAEAQNYKMQKYRIVKEVVLTEKEFIAFENSFIRTYSFIKDITYTLTMNSNAEYLCLLVTSDSCDHGILVNSSGYSYPRNVGLTKIGEEYGT